MANPEYEGIRVQLVGHSLGGEIAQLIGNASGCKTSTFNSAGAALVADSMEEEVYPANHLCGVAPRINHYRINGDFVSLLTDQIEPDNVITFDSTKGAPSAWPYDDFLEIWRLLTTYYHSIETLWTSISLELLSTHGVPDRSSVASASWIVNAVATGVDGTKEFLTDIASEHTPYYFDPPVAEGYVFDAGTGPLFKSVALPLRNDDDQYKLYIKENGNWKLYANLEGLQWYAFQAPLQTFAVGNWPSYGPTIPGVIFGLTFDSSGTFDGSVTPFASDADPVLTLPSDITVEAVDANGSPVSYTATATDNMYGSLPVNCVPPSGITFALGTTTVNCDATDAVGKFGCRHI